MRDGGGGEGATFQGGGARASCGGCLCERSLNDNAAHQGLSTTPSATHTHTHPHTLREGERESLGKLHGHVAAAAAITEHASVCKKKEKGRRERNMSSHHLSSQSVLIINK